MVDMLHRIAPQFGQTASFGNVNMGGLSNPFSPGKCTTISVENCIRSADWHDAQDKTAFSIVGQLSYSGSSRNSSVSRERPQPHWNVTQEVLSLPQSLRLGGHSTRSERYCSTN